MEMTSLRETVSLSVPRDYGSISRYVDGKVHVITVHYGSEQPKIPEYNHSLFHELGSERVSKRAN